MNPLLLKLWLQCKQFRRGEDGQNLTEYGLFIGLVVCGALAVVPDALMPLYHTYTRINEILAYAAGGRWYLNNN
ncbi:MAG: hypothetical protein ABL995_06080 [Bryobacteraceae bacterium]